MKHLSSKYIVRYQKGSDTHIFATLEERAKEAPWGDTWKIKIWDQDESLEAREDLLTTTEIPSQIPTNLEEVDKDVIGSKVTRKDVAKLWSAKDLLG